MIVPAHAELHYRARLVFEEPDLDGAEALKTTADALRAWCSGIFLAAGRELAVEAFRAGRTKLVSLAPPGEVRTLVPPSGSVGPVAMPAWALQARVPDPDIRHRQWAHEVAAGPIGERGWRVSVRVHHWLDVGEVGWRAPAPAAGPPGYLIPLADALGPTPTDGYAPLSRDPVPVDLGSG